MSFGKCATIATIVYCRRHARAHKTVQSYKGCNPCTFSPIGWSAVKQFLLAKVGKFSAGGGQVAIRSPCVFGVDRAPRDYENPQVWGRDLARYQQLTSTKNEHFRTTNE